jgi:hypothetical protein
MASNEKCDWRSHEDLRVCHLGTATARRAARRLKRENVHEEKDKKWKEAFMFCFRYYLGKKFCGANGN